jgi:hypothetical protein
MVNQAEMALIKRIRSLPSGTHLAIIQKDGRGVSTLSVQSSGKTEILRHDAVSSPD